MTTNNAGDGSRISYFAGQFVPHEQAKVPITAHVMNYGTGCFEGIRAYWNADAAQLYVTLLEEHVDRLLRSARILKLDFDGTRDELCSMVLELLRRNDLREDAYIRPLVYKADETIKVMLTGLRTELAAYCQPMGAYLDIDRGLRLTVSSWQRIDDNAIPARAKVIGSYVNAALASDDARQKGFDEALMLTGDGHLAEASSSNLFLVANGRLFTPRGSDDILVGITRAAVMELAAEMGVGVSEASIDRSEVLAADEVFLCGTGVQVAPVTEIDGRIIGAGAPGQVTLALQKRYLEVMRGEVADHAAWRTPVYDAPAADSP
ncbi:MAG: branched-chain amino acid aminotransferase [Frankiaceae bacterium]|nr:branched-chain amino acid aminotransferase [Frankiaceae bacterium]